MKSFLAAVCLSAAAWLQPAFAAEPAKAESKEISELRVKAEQGDADAQANLGVRYAIGLGVPKDEAEAYKWMLLAGSQGHEGAKKHITIIERTLTPTQRAEGVGDDCLITVQYLAPSRAAFCRANPANQVTHPSEDA